MNLKLSSYLLIPEIQVDNKNNCLVYSTRSSNSIVLNEATINDLRNNIFTNISKELTNKLIENKILVDSNEDEFESVINVFNEAKKNDTSLNFVIAPSANCQLGCNYCGQIHSKKNMEINLEENIINHIINKLEGKVYKDLDIVWYGGEPLLGIKSMERLTNKIKNICESKVLSYSASMITNGLNLNTRTFENLVLKLNVKSFQITLDGTKQTHDNSRFTKDLKPTFDIILNNIIKASKNPIYFSENVNISIRVNVHKNNVNEVNELIELLHFNKIHNKVDLYFAAVHDWGNNKADEKIGLSQHDFAEKEIEWLIKMNDLGFKKSPILPPAITGTCMTTSSDSELIDATGKISYCWEVPYTEEFIKDNSLTIGNLKGNEPLNYGREFPLRDWFKDIRSGLNNSSNCKKCIFLPNCGGSCPISWYKGNPACPSFKFNIEDRLIMEYLSATKNQSIETSIENN